MVAKPCAHPGCRTLVSAGTPRCASHQHIVDRERWQAADASRSVEPWRGWYKLKIWQTLRRATLARDGWTCQWPGCGVLLQDGRRHRTAAVVDHREPHRGEWRLFCDMSNLWSLCKHHHDTAKQREERLAAASDATKGGR